MFDEKQKKLLAAKLDQSNVKERDKGGTKLSYVEGWHAIAEANRIFGFDAWSRETIECREVCRYEKQNKYGKNNWVVGYEARVRVTVDGATREGTGHGSGQMPDLYDAIESAAKEAETDAMKRALMTFGNPFGLALYDKTHENVESAPPVPVALPAPPPPPEVDAMTAETLRQSFEGAPTLDELGGMVKRNAAKIRALETLFPAEHKAMMAAASKRKEQLTPKPETV